MVTGFDYLSKDKALQEHWLRRFVAIVIDSIVIWIPVWLLSWVLTFGFVGFWGLGSYGVLLFLYCTFFDLVIGGTVGKMLLRLKVVSVTGKVDIAQALLRNVSKIFFLLLILDWVLGMALDTQDPRQKWTDEMAKTSVMLH